MQDSRDALTTRHQLPVVYDTGVLAARVAGERGRAIMNGISTGITVVGLAGVLLYVRLARQWVFDEVFGMLTWFLSISAVAGIAILVARLVWLSRLRAGLDAVDEGVAFVVSSWGIEYADGHAAWDDIAHIAAAKGRLGQGCRLRVERLDGSGFDFPLEGLGILPGTLDAAVRAYSAGRHGVDLSLLDD